MRRTIPKQRRLFTPLVEDALSEELVEIDELIRLHPEWEEWILEDLTNRRRGRARRGREGMGPDLVLRLQFLKHRLDVSLRKLSKIVNDSVGFREFLGLGVEDRAPKRSTMQDNLAKVRPETWGKILHSHVQSQELREFESGDKQRVDATVVKANIHPPSDSSLLWDGVRTLTRLMSQARQLFPEVEFEDRSKQAKRLQSKIYWARRKEQRRPAYEALLKEVRFVDTQAERVITSLETVRTRSVQDGVLRDALASELRRYRGLTARVIDQTERRVVRGETVPPGEKLYSIFEPETDMIVKTKNRPPEFGHKVTFTMGVHFVLDCVVERGNPADVTLAVRQVERQTALRGKAPEQVAFDGGYASAANLEAIKALGAERCAFSKGRGLTPVDMAGSRRTFGRLRNFRAGIEGKISWLKRDFGLGRCTWKSWPRFSSYVWSACFAANLSKLARLRLSATAAPAKRAA
ncbi:MAG: ISNCY family transposase [Planctomycetes bacterium]|nr:ISNCY family transposase [Planctomycetota bacterium]MCO5169645.1 ISNCY family transposase [Planctomycetota bacterium]